MGIMAILVPRFAKKYRKILRAPIEPDSFTREEVEQVVKQVTDESD